MNLYPALSCGRDPIHRFCSIPVPLQHVTSAVRRDRELWPYLVSSFTRPQTVGDFSRRRARDPVLVRYRCEADRPRAAYLHG
ncbi:hypothetical protein RRG08_057446 [Elysia crispata]|uniref:Uncharacterized protein n=1 Tax=Elysia crispata TaxID=231223 RepID=A0AAE1DAD0_9GAST|nr:hypothetical protein RRG08_057446 [Elysia crispata]